MPNNKGILYSCYLDNVMSCYQTIILLCGSSFCMYIRSNVVHVHVVS